MRDPIVDDGTVMITMSEELLSIYAFAWKIKVDVILFMFRENLDKLKIKIEQIHWCLEKI